MIKQTKVTLLFLCFLGLSNIVLWSQDNPNGEIEKIIEQGQFLKALEKTNQTLTNTKTVDIQAHILFLKAKIHNGLYQRDSAIFYFEKAIENLNVETEKDIKKIALVECYLGNTIHPNSGLPLIEKALITFQNISKEPKYETAYAYFALARTFAKKGQINECLSTIDKALQYYPNPEIPSVLLGTIYSLKGYSYWKLNDFINGLKFLKTSENIFIAIGSEQSDYLGGTYINLGACSDDMGNIRNAIKYYEKALPILKAQNDQHALLRSVYNNLGNSYFKLRENDLTIQFTQAAIDCNPNHPRVGVYINNLARASFEIDEQKGIDYFHLAIEKLSPQIDRIPQELARPYHNLAAIYRQKKNYNLAIEYEKKALQLRLKKWGNLHLDVARSYIELGQFYKEKKDLTTAMIYLDSALFIQRKMIPNRQHHEMVTAYAIKAKNYYDLKNYDAWQIHFDSAFLASAYDGTSFENIKSPIEFMDAVNDQAQGYQNRYTIEGNQEFANAAKIAYEKATQALSHWRTTFVEDNSKGSLTQKYYPLFEGAIENAVARYQDQKDASALTDAFNYLEQSKALVLLEALQKTEALEFAGIPDSLLQKEKDLKLQITVLEKQAQNLADATEEEKANNRNQIFDLKRQYTDLKQQLETDFPNYYQLKNDVAVITLEAVQNQLLDSDQALIEYFVGDSSIFIFLIEKDDLKVHQIKKDFPLADWIKQMREGLYAYHITRQSDEAVYKSYNDKYVTAAYQLYEKLIAPFKANLPEKLIIIPDGILGYIPFDALLTEAPAQSHQFRSHPYLLQQHQISYSYSTTLLAEMQQKQHKATKNWLAFAPSFGDSKTVASNRTIDDNLVAVRAGLAPLDHNIPEVEAIQAIIKGDIYTGTNATRDKFIQESGLYKMLHLSTHGKANDKAGDYSFLAFTADDGAKSTDVVDNSKLYVRDLYNLKLNAEMVVLSACETGIGELQKGEGIISLARGFSYAGAKSILTTLWSVDDKNTKEIMLSFYEYLQTGMDKDEALRQAKLAYLEAHPHSEAHPFFWASFVPIGDMTAVSGSGVNRWVYLLGVLMISGMMLKFYFSKKVQV